MRYYNAAKDNCLQCCIAGILDLQLNDVVDVSTVDDYWVDTLHDWCGVRDYVAMYTYDIPEDGHYIGVVDWAMSGCHAVICSQNKMVHNPNPAHTEEFTGSLYNIILTKKGNNEPILQDNGQVVRSFMDSNNSA